MKKIIDLFIKLWFKNSLRLIFESIWFRYRYIFYKYSYDWGNYWKNIRWWKNIIIKWNSKNIYIWSNIKISDYTEISSWSWNWEIHFKDWVWISRNCIIWWVDNIIIDSNTIIWPYSFIVTSDHAFLDKNKLIKDQWYIWNNIYIWKNVWLWTKVIILKWVNIKENSIIWAWTIVTKNIEESWVYIWSPAKKIRDI